MKAGLLITGNGALLYLTSNQKYIDDGLVQKFISKGITKFIVYEISVDEARKKYQGHFNIVAADLRDTDDLRILDYDGNRAFKMFSFKELGNPYLHE